MCFALLMSRKQPLLFFELFWWWERESPYIPSFPLPRREGIKGRVITLTLPHRGGGDFEVIGRGDFKARTTNDLHLREVQSNLGYG